LLLIFTISAYPLAMLGMVPAEWFVVRKLQPAFSLKASFSDVFSTNGVALAVLGIGLPLVVSGLGLVGLFLPGDVGDTVLALGTWVGEGFAKNRLALHSALAWLVVGFFVNGYVKAFWFARRWRDRVGGSGDAKRVAWVGNVVSYPVFLFCVLLIWHELLAGGR